MTANLPELTANPYNYVDSECKLPCPEGSVASVEQATTTGRLYCNPGQRCGARAVYFSFKPRGASHIVWDPTVSGRAKTGGAKGGAGYFSFAGSDSSAPVASLHCVLTVACFAATFVLMAVADRR